MMDALGDWLKQIVLVVLLATFIDLLLPNRTMQRYVKLVVSLFILMTILTPVLQLLGTNVNVRMLAASEGWRIDGSMGNPSGGSGGRTGAGPSMPALGELLSEGEELARRRNEQSLQALAATLGKMVEEHVRTQHGRDAAAEASLALDEKGYPDIRSIRVRVGASLAAYRESDEEGGQGTSGAAAAFEPIEIEPVEIEPIRIGDGFAVGRAEGEAPPPVSSEERKRIAESVARAWSIPVSKVKVD